MAKTEKPAPPALPKLDDIASVAVAELPEPAKGATLTDDESALAAAIIAAASDGHAAVGPKLADRKEATAAAARVRRLIVRYIVAQGGAPDARPTLATRIVPKDGGSAWAITLTAPATPDAEESANGTS